MGSEKNTSAEIIFYRYTNRSKQLNHDWTGTCLMPKLMKIKLKIKYNYEKIIEQVQ